MVSHIPVHFSTPQLKGQGHIKVKFYTRALLVGAFAIDCCIIVCQRAYNVLCAILLFCRKPIAIMFIILNYLKLMLVSSET